MEVDEIFKKRELIKIPPSKEKRDSSIRIAESKLGEARKLFNKDFFDSAILSAYTSMFHSARALLYNEGIQEKSHYAVYVFLKEKYSLKISKELINSFYNYQKERHDILYGLEHISSNREDAEDAILNAEEFLFKIKEILKGGN